jgi:hypothetical protein
MGKKRSDSFFWNYRICEYKDGSYSLNEVFYEKGKPIAMTERAVGFSACADEGSEGVIKSLEMALSDVRKFSVLKVPIKWQKKSSRKMKEKRK